MRKRGIPVAESYVVLRGNDKKRADLTAIERQEEIERESKATKNRGQYYIEKAKTVFANQD